MEPTSTKQLAKALLRPFSSTNYQGWPSSRFLRSSSCLSMRSKKISFFRTYSLHMYSSIDFVHIKYLQQSELIDIRSSKVLPRECDFRDKIMRETFLIEWYFLDLTKRLIFLKGLQFSKSTFRNTIIFEAQVRQNGSYRRSFL